MEEEEATWWTLWRSLSPSFKAVVRSAQKAAQRSFSWATAEWLSCPAELWLTSSAVRSSCACRASTSPSLFRCLLRYELAAVISARRRAMAAST